jgi:hypothetical protein
MHAKIFKIYKMKNGSVVGRNMRDLGLIRSTDLINLEGTNHLRLYNGRQNTATSRVIKITYSVLIVWLVG